MYETGTRSGKRVQALGGAKNHMVVLPDADVDAAADAAVSAGYGSAGERCMAISVVVAVGDVGDALVDAIADRHPRCSRSRRRPASQMGPLITAEHRDRVRSYVDGAAAEGARVVVDGRTTPPDRASSSAARSSTASKPGMKRLRRRDLRPGARRRARPTGSTRRSSLVNRSPYGNGVALFTRDGGAARRFELEVQAGMVGINVPIPVPVAYHSFGGWKASLFGDTPMYGPEGIRFYTRPKVVTTRWPDPATSRIDLGFPKTR